MEKPGDYYDVPVLRKRPSASLYLLYLLLGAVSTLIVLFIIINNEDWGGTPGKIFLVGLVIFMGYSLVRLAGSLTKSRG